MALVYGRICRIAAGAILLATAPASTLAVRAASLRVVGAQFVLAMPGGQQLRSTDLVGAELETQRGQVFRIDAVAPAEDRPSVLLHTISVREGQSWRPLCDADAYGRRAAFPVAGRWEGKGRFIKDPDKWFLTCTSGSQGKCILWGYDPWSAGPHGEDLALFYQACQYTVRANYDGEGEAHTRNGTTIDVTDVAGVASFDTMMDARFTFEAGWGPEGAVCVARTRWPDLLSRDSLIQAAPRLGGVCDRAAAQRRGAIIFTRTMIDPVLSPAGRPRRPGSDAQFPSTP